jgi:hypothetical protein
MNCQQVLCRSLPLPLPLLTNCFQTAFRSSPILVSHEYTIAILVVYQRFDLTRFASMIPSVRYTHYLHLSCQSHDIMLMVNPFFDNALAKSHEMLQ